MTFLLLVLAVSALAIPTVGAEKGEREKARQKAKGNRVVHVVALKFKEGVTQEQIEKVCKGFAELKDKIPGIVRYQAGVNNSPEKLDKGFTHCFIVTFKNAKARDEYLPHPVHKEFAKGLGEVIADVFVIDFETQ
jgi:hypothetical protein